MKTLSIRLYDTTTNALTVLQELSTNGGTYPKASINKLINEAIHDSLYKHMKGMNVHDISLVMSYIARGEGELPAQRFNPVQPDLSEDDEPLEGQITW